MLDLQGLILALYALLSLVLPLPVRWYKRLLLVPFVLALGLKYHIYREVGGVMSPNLPPYVLLTLEALYGSLMLMVFFCLIKDVTGVLLFVLKRLLNLNFKVPRLALHALIATVSLALGFYGTFQQLNAPAVKEVTVTFPDLPPELDGLKIVQLTDLHIGPILRGDFIDAVVSKTNALKPDLVVITGDFVDGSTERLASEFDGLRRLKAPLGVYGVTGNHEYYSGAGAWVKALEERQVRMLMNEHVVLKHHGADFILAGIEDRRGRPDLKAAFRDSPEGLISLLLSHEPSDGMRHKVASLTLAGHTHGGTMFFLQPLIASYNGGFVSGLYAEDPEHLLYVSNGTGIWSGFSCRFLVPPEITLLTLKAS